MALSTRVNLHRAVSVQPLTSEQIERYLQSAGNQLDMLQHALHYDPELQEMAHQPLMLSIFTLAYQGAGPEELSTDGTREAQQRQVFATYVERMLTHRGVSKSTSREQTVRWLTFLAKRMQQYNQTVFYLEHLQPDWLTDRGRRLLYRLSVGLSIGLVFGVSAGLQVGLLTGLTTGVLTTLLATLIYGLGQIQPKEVLTLSWRWIKGNIVVGLLVALSIGLVLGGSFGDEATERLLLYKVGGGYIFTHRLLLDYFASLTPVAPTSAEKDGHRA